ncbi:MAG: hypothetical protein ACRDBY_03935, partial [Cetobacterium sp.]
QNYKEKLEYRHKLEIINKIDDELLKELLDEIDIASFTLNVEEIIDNHIDELIENHYSKYNYFSYTLTNSHSILLRYNEIYCDESGDIEYKFIGSEDEEMEWEISNIYYDEEENYFYIGNEEASKFYLSDFIAVV